MQDRLSRLLKFMAIYSPAIAKENTDVLNKKWKVVIKKLNDEQLRKGCEYVKTHECQFITPQRFIFVAHGLIDTELAFEQAREKIYNHPAIYHAAKKAKVNFSATSLENEFSNFRRAYALECDKVLNGEKLEPVLTNQNNASNAAQDNITYARWKSKIASQLGKDVADKFCVSENLTQKQCMDFLREKLGNNNKLIKILETNYGY